MIKPFSIFIYNWLKHFVNHHTFVAFKVIESGNISNNFVLIYLLCDSSKYLNQRIKQSLI